MNNIKENKIVRYIYEINKDKGTDLNSLWQLTNIGIFTINDMEDFYRLIGCSEHLISEIDAFNK